MQINDIFGIFILFDQYISVPEVIHREEDYDVICNPKRLCEYPLYL